ncbi:MAG: hypothetical protein KAT44_03365, partial [Pirellulales bacterium]|nr:hypothetical protein [Pirellulales bacterium]
TDANNTPTKRIIRVIGNDGNAATTADDSAYLIGTDLLGNPLSDGTSFDVPAGVTVMIDESALFKLRAANIDVGSSSPLVSREGASLQVLGTPVRNVDGGTSTASPVRFTSYHDDSLGGDSDGVGPSVVGGQWGGAVLRSDSDSVTPGVFLNTINQSELSFGDGNVFVDSQLQAFSPIHVEATRPTIAFNTVTNSAGAAISADPNSFLDDGDRLGPDIRGNRLIDNSINGLFVRIRTEFGSPIDTLDVSARFKSNDIVYVIQENLILNGGAGGYVQDPDSGAIMARETGRLVIDPGVVLKMQSSRIELNRGMATIIAEGTDERRVIITSLADHRFGAGGTFD